jgi:hypothetical protein
MCMCRECVHAYTFFLFLFCCGFSDAVLVIKSRNRKEKANRKGKAMVMDRSRSHTRPALLLIPKRQDHVASERSFKQGILNAETEQPETNGKQWVLDALGPPPFSGGRN